MSLSGTQSAVPAASLPRLAALGLAALLSVVVLLTVIFFLKHLTYASAQDPWGFLFASRQYERHGLLWNDPVVQTMQQMEREGRFPGTVTFFNGDYQWYYHGASGFFLPAAFAWLEIGVDRLFGLGAAFWIPLAGVLAMWAFLAGIGWRIGRAAGAGCLLLAFFCLVAGEPNSDAFPVLFSPYREPVVFALVYASMFCLLSPWRWRMIPAGLALGLACALREQMLVITPLFFLAMVLAPRRKGDAASWWKRAVLDCGVGFLGFAVGFFPWYGQRIAEHLGAMSLWSRAGGAHPWPGLFPAFQAASAARGARYLHWPPSMFPSYWEMLWRELGGTGGILAAVGIVGLVWRRQWAALVLLSIPGFCLLGLHSV